MTPPLLLPPPPPPPRPCKTTRPQLLLLQYTASKTAASSTGMRTGRRLNQPKSQLFSSSSSSSSPPSSEGLLLVGSNSIQGTAGDIDGNGARGLSSFLVVPPGGSKGGSGGSATEGRPAGNRGSNSGWSTAGTLGEKVVTRALECLEKLCSSQQCERYMTPLAREVSLVKCFPPCERWGKPLHHTIHHPVLEVSSVFWVPKMEACLPFVGLIRHILVLFFTIVRPWGHVLVNISVRFCSVVIRIRRVPHVPPISACLLVSETLSLRTPDDGSVFSMV